MTIHRPDPLKHVLPGPRLAIAAEALFLFNLMFLPGLAFLLLVWLWSRQRRHPDPLVRNHLEQTLVVSLWGGALVLGVSLAIFLLGGFDNPWAWVVGVLYFVLAHGGLILLGVLGLVRAINGHYWRYPLVGPPLPVERP